MSRLRLDASTINAAITQRDRDDPRSSRRGVVGSCGAPPYGEAARRPSSRRRAPPGSRASPPSAASRSAMPWRPGPCRAATGSNPTAVIGDLERQGPVRAVRGERSPCVALAYFATFWSASRQAEVDGRFRLLRIPADPVRLDVDGDRDLPRLRLEGRGETLVREQRRIDPAGEISEVLERVVRLAFASASIAAALRGVRFATSRSDETELHGQRDQLLLRTVVDVALELPGARSSCAATIRRRDSRSSSISRTFRSTRPCLRSEVADELSFVGFIGSFGAHRSTVIAPRSSPWWRTSTAASSPRSEASSPPGTRAPRAWVRPSRPLPQLGADTQPYARAARTRPLSDIWPSAGGRRRRRTPPPTRPRELRQHFVRRRPPPVHEPVGESGRGCGRAGRRSRGRAART